MEKSGRKSKVKKFFKRLGLLIVVVFIVAFFLDFGNSSHHNYPPKLRVTAKTDSGLHVHIGAKFSYEREFVGCQGSPDLDYGQHQWQEIYHDIPESGIDLLLKKSFPDFCKSKMEKLIIVCSRSSTYFDPNRSNVLFIYPLNAWHQKSMPTVFSGTTSVPTQMNDRIPGNLINITFLDGRNDYTNLFFLCEKNCEETEATAIDETSSNLNITCTESHDAH